MGQLLSHLIDNLTLGAVILCSIPIRVRFVREPDGSGNVVVKWFRKNVISCFMAAAGAFFLNVYVRHPSSPMMLVDSAAFLAWAAMSPQPPWRRVLKLNEAEMAARHRALRKTITVFAVYIAVVLLFWGLAPHKAAYAVQIALGLGLVAWNVGRLLRINWTVRREQRAAVQQG